MTQKETKKCGCKSHINVKLSINSSVVILEHYYKHLNHYPGKLSDLSTLPLSENIWHFIQKHILEGLDTFSIQKILRFRVIELQDQVKKECSDTTKSYSKDMIFIQLFIILWKHLHILIKMN